MACPSEFEYLKAFVFPYIVEQSIESLVMISPHIGAYTLLSIFLWKYCKPYSLFFLDHVSNVYKILVWYKGTFADQLHAQFFIFLLFWFMNHFISFCSLILEIYVDLFQSTRERREWHATSLAAPQLKESNWIMVHVLYDAKLRVRREDTVPHRKCVFALIRKSIFTWK
jgi:hypothetical protein